MNNIIFKGTFSLGESSYEFSVNFSGIAVRIVVGSYKVFSVRHEQKVQFGIGAVYRRVLYEDRASRNRQP